MQDSSNLPKGLSGQYGTGKVPLDLLALALTQKLEIGSDLLLESALALTVSSNTRSNRTFSSRDLLYQIQPFHQYHHSLHYRLSYYLPCRHQAHRYLSILTSYIHH